MLILILVEDLPIKLNPCQPSPCGPNAQCKIIDDSPSCSCLVEFIGSPPNCRPECVSNSECFSHLACMKQKCRDPCPGTCGANANCRVISHTPNCICQENYIGDPFTICTVQKRETNIYYNCSFLILLLSQLIDYYILFHSL